MKIVLLITGLFIILPFFPDAQTVERSLNNNKWEFKKTGESLCFPAKIPGTVHTDLFANGLIPDPFAGDNEKKLQWIENEDWVYRTNFNISSSEIQKGHIELKFEALDTYAKIFMNDSLVGTADNMFRIWKMNVKPFVKEGENKLTIQFTSSVRRGKELAKQLPYTLPGDEKVFTRKAQYQYGWDWGPRFVTCGIGDVKLVSWNKARISQIQSHQELKGDSLAELEFICTVFSDSILDTKINLVHHTGNLFYDRIEKKIRLFPGENRIQIKYSIPKPELWWSNGLGAAHLYVFGFYLSLGKNDLLFEEVPLDFKSISIGIRTIELVQKTDSMGSSFYFKLNGVPVFMKGANYIPPDNFLNRVRITDYQSIIKNAAEANMNMLRVWGGGVYADDAFYQACDENGILVWQDFMFACAMYPGDRYFVENVSAEITDQVQGLRNHPCIALWCGNNEIDEGWKNWGWQNQYHYSFADSSKIESDYQTMFEKQIKNILLKEDPGRPYWPSSPSIGWGHGESLKQGDSHYWGIWWGLEPFEMYEKKLGRFMSEYGFQGMPPISTFKSFMPDFNVRFDSAAFKNHQKHPAGYQTIRTYMERDFKVPKNFEDYIYVSQLLQAEGMKTAMESHRRAKPYCMGTLYWQFNDCWPVTSWSSIDYYGNRKAFYYQAKRLFEDVLISFVEKEEVIEVHMVSDKMDTLRGILNLQVMNFKGQVYSERHFPIMIEPNSGKVFFKMGKDLEIIKNLNFNKLFLHAEFTNENGVVQANYFFSKQKDIDLPKPHFNINKIDKTTFEIVSDVFAKSVYLKRKEGEIKLSDNFFDLLPGQKKRIQILENKLNLDPARLQIKSLYDIHSDSLNQKN